MKKILFVAVAALASLTAMAQPKFAHVNVNELVQLMPEMDEARNTINAIQQEASETYQTMIEEYNTKYNQYSAKVNTWTAAIKETKEKELMDIQNRIQEYSQNIQAELQQQQEALLAPIYQKANDTVQELSKKGGYIYVFDISSVLYVDPSQSVDLTPEARKVLKIAEGRTLETLAAELEAKAKAAASQQ